MDYRMTSPCGQCPFLRKMSRGFTMDRLAAFAAGSFHCHMTGATDEDTGDFVPLHTSAHCAGALIYLERRDAPNQMMRIAERLGLYDRTKLNMEADVR